MKKVGVFLGRMQPIHNGHLAMMRQMLKENDQVLVLVGSASTINERNPIPVQVRMRLIMETIKEEFDDKEVAKISLFPLNDLSSEDDNSYEWGFYLYATIVGIINQSSFTMYYSDGFEIITKWFPSFILSNHVNLSLIARGVCEDGVSATKVRDVIMKGGAELSSLVPKAVVENRKLIKAFIEVWK